MPEDLYLQGDDGSRESLEPRSATKMNYSP